VLGPLLKDYLEKTDAWPPPVDEAVSDVQSRQGSPLAQLVLLAMDDAGGTISRWPVRPMSERLAEAVAAARGAGAGAYRTVEVPAYLTPDATEPEIVPVRYGLVRVSPRGHAAYTLVCGTSRETSARFSRLMLRVLGAALLLTIGGSAAVGWIVAGRASERLGYFTRQVEAVSPTRLKKPPDLPGGPDEIGRLGRAVNEMLLRLASAFQSQDYFIANVSHELRTPVASLLAEAQVLKSYRDDPESHERFVLSVEEEMRRLSTTVETLLALARMSERGETAFTQLVSLDEVAMESAQHMALPSKQRGVKILLHVAEPGPSAPDALVAGDADLLRVAVDNLLRNAVQHSSPGDEVVVHVRQEGTSAVVVVEDSGPGIPEQYLDRIFGRRFEPSPDRTMTTRGTGLGLHIAGVIVGLHAGTLTAANKPGRGSVFTLSVPIAPAGG
jgi:signal transduction histidine kinase